jgi:hypothetical protein
MNIVRHDPELARQTRLRLWAEQLELLMEEIPSDPIQAIDQLWKPISKEQLQRREAGQPLTHRLVPTTERPKTHQPRARPAATDNDRPPASSPSNTTTAFGIALGTSTRGGLTRSSSHAPKREGD